MSGSQEHNSTYQLQKYHKRRALAISLLGSECRICGRRSRLQFDHVDPKTKSFDLSTSWSKPWEDILSELKKCQLLCKACHVEKTRSEQIVEKHGTWGQIRRRKCKCEVCRAFVNAYNREYKRERRMLGSRD